MWHNGLWVTGPKACGPLLFRISLSLARTNDQAENADPIWVRLAYVFCGAANLTSSSYRRENPKLLQHAEVVYQNPLLCDLAISKTEDLDGR